MSRGVAVKAAKALSAPSAAAVGEALLRSCSDLLDTNTDTRPVSEVHRQVAASVRAVSPGSALYVFGSTAVYGFHEANSDVDFVALSAADVAEGTAADADSELSRAVQADFIARLSAVLRQAHAAWQVEVVRRTRVPVLRVKGGAAVDFDVTAGRRCGVRNSALLRAYLTQNMSARWLGVAVKRWSKRAGLNSSMEGGCLTSYGFNLMLAYYMLRRGVAQFVPPESCDVAQLDPMPPYLPLELPSDGGLGLGEMALDFVLFYLREFDAESEVISLSRAKPTRREDLDWTKQAEDMARIRNEKVHYRWCVEDPFEHNLNVGRHITPFKLMLLRKHLERAYETGLLTLC